MNDDLVFKDTCVIYDTTLDGYGREQLGDGHTVQCMYVQATGYQHSGSQDAIVGSSRIAFPGGDSFLTSIGYRLEGRIVEVNPFGVEGASQRFKITNVSPARDVLFYNQVHHVECDLKKVETQEPVVVS